MSSSVPPNEPNNSDYLAIEAAVMETARGRWFLGEYARRNRATDTASVLEALDKLEALAEPLANGSGDRRLFELSELLVSVRAAPWQGAADREGRPAHIRPQQTAEGAITAMRRASEKIREVAFELRESGKSEMYASALELYCTDLVGAADLQEAALSRLSELAALLSTMEDAIAAPGQSRRSSSIATGDQNGGSEPSLDKSDGRLAGDAAEADEPLEVTSAPNVSEASLPTEPIVPHSATPFEVSDGGSEDRAAPALTFVNPG